MVFICGEVSFARRQVVKEARGHRMPPSQCPVPQIPAAGEQEEASVGPVFKKG